MNWRPAEKIWMGQMQKNYGLANTEKIWLVQCRKENIIKPKGAALRSDFSCIGQPIFFLHWPTHVFSAFGPSIFFRRAAESYFIFRLLFRLPCNLFCQPLLSTCIKPAINWCVEINAPRAVDFNAPRRVEINRAAVMDQKNIRNTIESIKFPRGRARSARPLVSIVFLIFLLVHYSRPADFNAPRGVEINSPRRVDFSTPINNGYPIVFRQK